MRPLTYRSLRLPLYTGGATLDVNAKARLLGTLGETATADYTAPLVMLQRRMAGNLPWMMRNSL